MTATTWALILWIAGVSSIGYSPGANLLAVFPTEVACRRARTAEIERAAGFGALVERGTTYVILEWNRYPDPDPLRRSPDKFREVRVWECRGIQ